MCKNRVLRMTFGSKREEITEEWVRMHKEGRYDLYSPNIIRVIKNGMGWACDTYGGWAKCAQVCGGESWGKQTT